MRAEQVDGRDLLVAALKPDMGCAAAWPGGGDVFGNGIVDGDRWRAIRHDRRRLVVGSEDQPLFVQELLSRQDFALPRVRPIDMALASAFAVTISPKGWRSAW